MRVNSNGLCLDDQGCQVVVDEARLGEDCAECKTRSHSRTILGGVKSDVVNGNSIQLGRQLRLDGIDKVSDIFTFIGGHLDRLVDARSVVGLEQNP